MTQDMSNPNAIKTSISINEDGFEKKGDITPALNQAAAIIFAKSDKTFNCKGFNTSMAKIVTFVCILRQVSLLTKEHQPQEFWQGELAAPAIRFGD